MDMKEVLHAVVLGKRMEAGRRPGRHTGGRQAVVEDRRVVVVGR